MKIYLVRHGQTIENARKILMGHRPGHLTRQGIRQAKLLGQQLDGQKFDTIYCSDLKRAKDTLKIILKYIPKTPIIYTRDLRETNLGAWQGKMWGKLSFKDLPGNFMTKKPPGGESLQDLQNRISKFLNSIKKKHPNNKILIISHNAAIRMFLAIIKKKHIRDIFHLVDPQNTSVCEITIGDKKTRVHCIDKVEHLINREKGY